jgi:hypothetical protein
MLTGHQSKIQRNDQELGVRGHGFVPSLRFQHHDARHNATP